MKSALGALLCAIANAAGGGCGFLELRALGDRGGEIREIPLYLAVPDSIGSLDVNSFLQATPEQAAVRLRQADGLIRELSMPQRRALKALRDLVDGRVRQAAEGIASVAGRPDRPGRLARNRSALMASLAVNRGLILHLGGLATDAEKEWRAQSDRGDACAEAARRNIFSVSMSGMNLEKARILVDGILAESPKDRWANDAKAYLARLNLSDEEWGEYLRRRIHTQDSLFDLQIAYGRYLKDHGRYEEAKRFYSQGLEGAPRNGKAWLELADVYYRLDLLFLANSSLEKCFEAGIADPYVYELLGRVLMGISAYASEGKTKQDQLFGVLDMRDLQWGLGPEWADRCWRLAERNLESGFSHDLHSRSLAQLLYHVYCRNGKVEAAKNLRDAFWFHFTGPRIHNGESLGAGKAGSGIRLPIASSPATAQWVQAASETDFFESF